MQGKDGDQAILPGMQKIVDQVSIADSPDLYCSRCAQPKRIFFSFALRLDTESINGSWCKECFGAILNQSTALKLVMKGILGQVSEKVREILDHV